MAEGPLNLSDLCQADFWRSVSSPDTRKTPVCVVLPSGRSRLATSGHLALISDALHTHEVVLAIDQLSRTGGLDGAEVKSMLDIDFYEALAQTRNARSEAEKASAQQEAGTILTSNVLTFATADINVVTKLLLEELKSEEAYGIGFRKPYEDCGISGGQGKRYAVSAYPNIGVLAAYWSPWATPLKRIAIVCGGVLAPGSLGATRLLLRYLCGEAKGNNRFLPDRPVRIISASIRDYRYTELLPTAECLPNHELRNITEELIIHE